MSQAATGALRRVITGQAGGRAAGRECCELCGAALPSRHRHVLDKRQGEPLCVCTACGLLFEREGAALGRYRLIPPDRARLPGISPESLGVPVGLAYFVRQDDGTVLAHYPSPAGATRWEVDAAAWDKAVRACPRLRDLLPGVQALLVNTARGKKEHWLVPIDDCYRLVALIGRTWRGLSGGSRVWPAIDGFFAELARAVTGEANSRPSGERS